VFHYLMSRRSEGLARPISRTVAFFVLLAHSLPVALARTIRRYLWWLLGLSVLFILFPGIDILVATPFYGGDGFPWGHEPFVRSLRQGVEIIATTSALVLVIAFCVHRLSGRSLNSRNGRVLLFLIAAYIVGPGILVNAVLKEFWGRARPYQVEIFPPGEAEFSRAYVITDQCASNCSFVSGDVSIAFMMVGFALVLPRRYRRGAAAVALGYGCAVAFLRVFVGAHWFSDVVLSAMFTLGVMGALYHLIVHQRWRLVVSCWRNTAPG